MENEGVNSTLAFFGYTRLFEQASEKKENFFVKGILISQN